MPYDIEVSGQIWNKKVFTREMDFFFALKKFKTVLHCFNVTILEKFNDFKKAISISKNHMLIFPVSYCP